ncbi:MAG: proline dehydrogenase family protein, partial [Bdellovibrionales bacterium]|nr:proline dehydrogenase family protein [Bdellovibrionales bacterium]
MSLDTEIRNRGEAIFKQMDAQTQSLFNKDFWYGRIMEESMKNTAFKTQMFRFVDVLPYLKSGTEVARHLKEYFAEGGEELPGVFKFGVGIGSFAPGIMAGVIRKQVTEMAKMFIAGQTAEEALPLLKKGRQNQLGFTADLLGESALSEKEALEYQRRYLDLMQGLSKDAETWATNETLDKDHLGAIPKVNVSVKVSSLYSQVNVKDWAGTKEILKERLRPLLSLAKDRHMFLNLDMEQYSLKDLTLEIFQELLMEPSYATYPHFGIVIQAYLKDAHKDCQRMVDFARTRKVPFTIRLVKGAYWDYETIQAQARDWPCPVFTNKADSDVSFEECATVLLKNLAYLKAAFGSHNVRSIAFATVTAEKMGIPKNSFEIQMLYGMAEPIKKSLVQMGYRVREYVPIGELIPGMAYLVRRLLENTSNESFLKSKFADNTDSSLLLRDPREKASLEARAQFGAAEPGASAAAAVATPSSKVGKPRRAFENEPLLDFGIPEVRTKMIAAIDKLSKRSPITIPAVIGKKEITLSRTVPSVNPSHPTQVLAHVGAATALEVDQAVQMARTTLTSWSQTTFEERANFLDLLAKEFRQNKYELAAQQVLEVGKTWSEADGD